ncbi:dolichyldiphosphatase 1-like [Littorina saxatilis]|uniref:Dolichyldiphosphatase n=1 Tax=Littorina saxatilis TaxID=31220 RepID=A0AAN9AYE6_9CAEN
MADSESPATQGAFSDAQSGSQCDDMAKWKAVSLTHVEYLKGDLFGQLLAVSSLLPVCFCVSFVTLIIFRRDLHTMCFFLGLLCNECLNWFLKHLIREARPRRGRQNLYTEFGMPSSHSQFIWFFTTYLIFFIWIRVHRNYNFLDDLWKILVCVGGGCLATVVTYSRVYLEYHTFSQVLWGAVVGVTAGSLWFGLIQLVATPLFPHIASSPLGELFMLRDSTLIPHVLWFEYTSSRSEARSRQRKVTSRKSQ